MKELKSVVSLCRLRRNLHISPEALRHEQTRKLREVVHHAYETTPYYRRLLEAAGVHPRDIRTLADLPRVPFSRKEDLLRSPLGDRISIGTDPSTCLKVRTSGTTGTPWDTFISPPEKIRRVVTDLRALLVNGYRPFDTTCVFVGPRSVPGPRYWFQHMGLLRRRYVSHLESIENKLGILTKGEYDVIYDFPCDLYLLAEAMLERGMAPSPPKLVLTNGEMLQPSWRRAIHQAFGRDPTDFYGLMEFGYIAWQCPERDGYHVNADLFIVEFVNDGTIVGPGEEGELVITDLTTRAMPLIRFATGDRAVTSSATCPCGIALPALASLNGKVMDYLHMPSGRKVAPVQVTVQMKGVAGVGSFKVVQVSGSEVVVSYTRRSDANEDTSTAILNALRPIMDETVELHVEEVDNIASSGGKFKMVENALLRAGQPS